MINRRSSLLPYEQQNRRNVNMDGMVQFFRMIHSRHALDELAFVCIGTDRSTGDALGPLTGSGLEAYGIPSVIGTLEQPCDAHNLHIRIPQIPAHRTVIAIDACLGQQRSVGLYSIGEEPLFPALSVGGQFPGVGTYSIAAIVNENGPKPYWTLQTTSLRQVMRMSDDIVQAAVRGLGLRG
ncbi:spore protease YyaC [Paenibacillus hunanensis]|uniref:spore protease YyaC n=1 Tax=Paenibacillus hunanensis TaxID=539262 RepID=UPI002A6A717E|nr:spore protease YyaC [Paenibacillus hunanensis]WPP40748.1 spore protease YyaC [Paenibacillus hunanensis]